MSLASASNSSNYQVDWISLGNSGAYPETQTTTSWVCNRKALAVLANARVESVTNNGYDRIL
jgi:hypothetical protein